MGKLIIRAVIRLIEDAAALGVVIIAAWTGLEIVKAYAGWWPAMIFAGCIVVIGILPDRDTRDDKEGRG